MKHTLIKAKCPYCKAMFDWERRLIGDYSPDSVEVKCKLCGNLSFMTACNIMKFTAKKQHKKTPTIALVNA